MQRQWFPVMGKQRGIILAEVVLAIVLSSGLLAIVVGWQQRQQQVEAYEQQLDYARQLMMVLQNYQQEFGSYPEHLAEIQASGYWENVFPTVQKAEWQWEFTAPFLDIRAQLPSAGQARWVAAQLPDARSNNAVLEIRMVQAAIISAVDTSVLLHRVAVADNPQLNQLATHISMQGHDIRDVGTLTANAVTAQQADMSRVNAEELRVENGLRLNNTRMTAVGNRLTVTAGLLELQGPVTISGLLDLQGNNLIGVNQLTANQLNVQQVNGENVTANKVTTELLQVDDLQVSANLTLAQFHSHDLQVDLLTADTLTATTLSANQATINQLQADYIYATDVIAGARSISENYDLINTYQALWEQCVDVGGCQ